MPAHEVAIFCKSFRGDFDRLEILLKSVVAQKIDTPLLISAPQADLPLLQSFIPRELEPRIVADESYVIPGTPFEYGWLQQQICKLSVYRTEFAQSYIMIDSDTYFINGVERVVAQCQQEQIVSSTIFTKFFSHNKTLIDFINDREAPFPVLEISADVHGFGGRMAALKPSLEEWMKKGPNERGHLINHLFSVPNIAFQPSQLFHSRILAAFSDFLREHGMDFYSCIRLSPWEYNWYACFALANWPGGISGACSPVLHFASEADILDAKKMGLTVEDFKRRFVAIQMAARHFDALSF